jgi:hypothetical protein
VKTLKYVLKNFSRCNLLPHRRVLLLGLQQAWRPQDKDQEVVREVAIWMAKLSVLQQRAGLAWTNLVSFYKTVEKRHVDHASKLAVPHQILDSLEFIAILVSRRIRTRQLLKLAIWGNLNRLNPQLHHLELTLLKNSRKSSDPRSIEY